MILVLLALGCAPESTPETFGPVYARIACDEVFDLEFFAGLGIETIEECEEYMASKFTEDRCPDWDPEQAAECLDAEQRANRIAPACDYHALGCE